MSRDFGKMFCFLDEGNKMRRESWGENTFIVKMPELYLPPYNTESPGPKVNDRTAKHIGNDKPLDSQPYIALYKDGKWYPGWLPSTEDLFGKDWCTVEPCIIHNGKLYCVGGSNFRGECDHPKDDSDKVSESILNIVDDDPDGSFIKHFED